MFKKGRKTKAWDNARNQLKNDFIKLGIINCEIRFSTCWRDQGLGFAHTDKRRFLSEEDLKNVVLACLPCHEIAERFPREKMKAFLQGIIDRRNAKISP